MPDFGIMRGFNEKLFGDKLVAGQLPTQLGLIGSQEVTDVDADWLSYYNRVIAAGGSLTTNEQNATKTLVADLKAYGIWSAMKAVYPMVGASAVACAQNLKSSSFTGTFSSGWTFASGGVTGNGTSSYMNTNFQPSSLLDGGNWFLYINNNGSNQGISRDFGYGNYVDREVGLAVSYAGSSYGLHGLYSPQQYNIFSNNPVVLGFYQSNQYNGNNSSFLNNSKIVTRSQSFTYANYNMYLGAELNINTNNAETPSDRRYAFAGISDGLNDTQSSNFYTAVQAFQTTLSRQV